MVDLTRLIGYAGRVIRTTLNDCLQGKTPTKNEAMRLAAARDEELATLLQAASELRDRHKGNTITISPKVFIPLTNLCRDFCGYCTFRKAPDEPGAKTMTVDEVLAVVRR